MILLGIIFVNLIIFDAAKCQQNCSDIANYYSDNNGIYGQIEFTNVPIQHENSFEIELSVAARLPSGNGGSIDMLNKDAYNDLLNGRKIILKFIPEIESPVPIVSGVFLNGNRICSSPPARGRTVSTITLSFSYTISGLPQIDESSFISNNQSYVCGVRGIHQNNFSLVSDGKTARRNDFPWLTVLNYRENEFICGGTLVSTKIIVTAANCVKNKEEIEEKSPEDSTFYLGKYKLNDLNEKDYVTARVKEFIIHPSWNSLEEPFIGDIAIAVIYRTIKFTNNIIPLCLPPQKNNHEDIVDKTGLVAGWGITVNETISDVPIFVSLPVVDDEECLTSDEVFAKIKSNTTFCVGDGSGKSPCNGDAGGAFAMKNDADERFYFRGIVSSGFRGNTSSCDNNKYVLFTDVAQYTDWIKSYITMYG